MDWRRSGNGKRDLIRRLMYDFKSDIGGQGKERRMDKITWCHLPGVWLECLKYGNRANGRSRVRRYFQFSV